MHRFEYKIVPAPNRGLKAKGIKGAEARFANALEDKMNVMAAEGWEYQRAETLPSLERSGLTSTTTEWRNVLVFRRLRENDAEAFKPELLPPPTEQKTAEPETAVVAEKAEPTAPAKQAEEAKKEDDDGAQGAAAKKADLAEELVDNGVEDTGDVSVISSSLGKLAEARKLSKTNT